MASEKMDAAAFEEAYARLNAAQKKAVDTIEGPVMVIAGPGTGKTQILALRIANIIQKTDTSPSSILALTFTESGVASMRARLVSLMGQEGYRVRIHTFHGFCNEVIRVYPDRFPSIIGRIPLIEIDAIRIIKDILDDIRPKLLRPHGAPDFYVRDIVGKISETKREHMTPDALAERIATKRSSIEHADDLYHTKGAHAGKMKGHYIKELAALDKAFEFVAIYRRYEEALEANGFYDFDDTIIAVIEALARDEELKLMVQEDHQYILADEHQDANGSQNELLTLLSDFHTQPNLFVVGDEKQAIYRFQGASLENFFSFTRQYPNAVVIPLSDNYRSTQLILDAAHTLIASARGAESVERVRLSACATHDAVPLEAIRAPEEDTEHTLIAERVLDLISCGTAPQEIAILVRRNADVAPIASALSRHGIVYRATGDDPVLTHPVVRGFRAFLAAVANYGDDTYLLPALLLPYSGIPTLDVYRLTNTRKIAGATLAGILGNPPALADLHVEHIEECVAFSSVLESGAKMETDMPLAAAIERMLWTSGCMTYALAQPDALAVLEVLRTLFRYITSLIEAHPAYRLSDILSALTEAETYRLSLKAPSVRDTRAVSVMTAHRSKGMEFDHVFIPHVHDRGWGGKRAVDRLPLPLFETVGGNEEDDERRLFYVAMTRARKTLVLSYAEQGGDGTLQVPSRFLEELKDGAHVEEQIITTPAQFFRAPVEAREQTTLSDEEKKYLRDRLFNQGLSVSALNNYLESPWKYFFMNLVRVPQARVPHLLYGSAMDEALKWYTNERAVDRTPSSDEVIRVFIHALGKLPMTQRDFETYRDRGKEALTGYLAEYAKSWHVHAESAVSFKIPFETGIPGMPTIMLRGELDKVEHLSNGEIRVVDYKTGSPKTRGEIEGTTKTSNGNLKRQLVFYKLLVERDDVRKWRTDEGVLDFVEPDKKGKYRRENFSLTGESVAELEEVIHDVLRGIYDFTFWETACTKEDWSAEGVALIEAIKNRKSTY